MCDYYIEERLMKTPQGGVAAPQNGFRPVTATKRICEDSNRRWVERRIRQQLGACPTALSAALSEVETACTLPHYLEGILAELPTADAEDAVICWAIRRGRTWCLAECSDCTAGRHSDSGRPSGGSRPVLPAAPGRYSNSTLGRHNLVDNAGKYARGADDRTLHLTAAREGRRLVLRLRDHEPGIGRGERGRLFRPFHKAAREATHSAPCVGLGLALSRRLARQMGGELRLDHTVRNGAAFVLTLPVGCIAWFGQNPR